MYTTEIETCRLAITKVRRAQYNKRKRQGAPEVFVPISYFTVRQLADIINEVRRFPLKDCHLFAFDGERYLVRVYSDDPDRPKDNDKRVIKWVG